MARTKNRLGAAPSAAHAATDPAPAPVTAPAPDSPAAAVWAALAASPGGTVTAIADAAGTGKPAARDALLAMEKDGTATRVKGGKPGIPDTWTLAGPAPDDAGPAEADPEAVRSADGTASGPDGPGGDETAGEAEFTAAGTASPGQQDSDANAAPEAADDAAPDGGEDARDGEALPDSGDPQEHGGGPREDAVPEDSGGEAGDAPDPGLVSAMIERLGQISAAADAAGLVLTASGDLKAALAGMDEICEQAAEARRALKAAASGRKVPAARPGGLRDKVLAHLAANPGKEFTPHEIHKVLGHSSGAIANALDTLVRLGEAEVASEKPRRFRRAAQPLGAAPGADGTDSADSTDGAQEAGTELAGAA